MRRAIQVGRFGTYAAPELAGLDGDLDASIGTRDGNILLFENVARVGGELPGSKRRSVTTRSRDR